MCMPCILARVCNKVLRRVLILSFECLLWARLRMKTFLELFNLSGSVFECCPPEKKKSHTERKFADMNKIAILISCNYLRKSWRWLGMRWNWQRIQIQIYILDLRPVYIYVEHTTSFETRHTLIKVPGNKFLFAKTLKRGSKSKFSTFRARQIS